MMSSWYVSQSVSSHLRNVYLYNGHFKHLTLCVALIWLLVSIALHLQNVGLLLPSNLGAKEAPAFSH